MQLATHLLTQGQHTPTNDSYGTYNPDLPTHPLTASDEHRQEARPGALGALYYQTSSPQPSPPAGSATCLCFARPSHLPSSTPPRPPSFTLLPPPFPFFLLFKSPCTCNTLDCDVGSSNISTLAKIGDVRIQRTQAHERVQPQDPAAVAVR